MRDIQKALEDYKRITHGQDKFYTTDITQIYDLAKSQDTGKTETFSAIGNALQAGFVIGYRYANRGKR